MIIEDDTNWHNCHVMDVMCATKVGKFKETFSPRSKFSTVDFKFSYIIDDLIGCS
jgi:hypothetical protein